MLFRSEGLEKKIERGIDRKKVGYAEFFSRFGKKHGKILSMSKDGDNMVLSSEQKKDLMLKTATMIAKANAPEADVPTIVRASVLPDGMPSLRRIFKRIMISA